MDGRGDEGGGDGRERGWTGEGMKGEGMDGRRDGRERG